MSIPFTPEGFYGVFSAYNLARSPAQVFLLGLGVIAVALLALQRSSRRKKGYTENGQLRAGVKAGEIIKWLKEDFDLGHGHSMAIVAVLKGSKGGDSK